MRQGIIAAACFTVLAATVAGEVKVYKNDSVPGTGGPIICQPFFASKEIGAAIYTVPAADAPILLLEAQWYACDGSGFGLAQPRPMQVLLYGAGGPDPGAPFYTSPNITSTPGTLNVHAFDTLNTVYGAAQPFTVGVRHVNGSLFQNFTVLAGDADGCQPEKNLLYVVTLQDPPFYTWNDACFLGVQSDLVVRMKVLTKGPKTYGTGLGGSNGVPAISASGKWSIGSTNFALKCVNAKPLAPGYLFLGLSPNSLPTHGGTLLVGSPGLTLISIASDASGQVNLPAALPDNLAFVDVHVYFQFAFVDAAAPAGASFSNGLDLLISASS